MRAAQDAGHAVTALPGASAVLAASDRRGLADRSVPVRRLSAAEGSRAAQRASPNSPAFRRRWCCSKPARALAATLADLAAGLGRTARGGAVPRTHQAARGSPARRSRGAGGKSMRERCAARRDRSGHRAAAGAASRSARPKPRRLLRQALARVSLKDAVGEVADATGLPRREVYQRALALAKEAKDGTGDDHGAPR